MSRRLMYGGAAGATLALATAVITASAHAVITAGAYRLAIGWEYEPAGGTVTYVGQPNGIQVFVDSPTPSDEVGTPVGDLNGDCAHPDFQVTVAYAGKTSSPYCPAPSYDPDTRLGRQDEYDAPLTPTRVGTYTFHLFGTIHGTPVDKTIASGPSTFDSLGDQTSVEFPTALPALGEVASKVDAVGTRAAEAASSANDAASSANRAAVLSIVALILAALLGGAGLVVTLRRRI